MFRYPTVLVGVMAMALIGFTSTDAYADAPADEAGEPSCTYTLTPPQLVQVSGATMVKATLTPHPCTGSITPNSLTVCVSAQGVDADQCGFSSEPNGAQVYFTPYRPGTAYYSEGVGCGSVFDPPGSICSTVGPFTATL
jgi:hypothetical protein